MAIVQFIVHGEPAAKGNSRRMVLIGGKPRLIKSAKGIGFAEMMAGQCPVLKEPMTGDVRVDIMILYASRRPDLDESLILDGMNKRVYVDDRQVKEKHVYWGLDRANPRSIIRVTPLTSLAPPDWMTEIAKFT